MKKFNMAIGLVSAAMFLNVNAMPLQGGTVKAFWGNVNVHVPGSIKIIL